MIDALIKFKSLLEKRDLLRLGCLLAIIVLMSLLEVIGIASVLPFLYLAANPEAIQEQEWLAWLFEIGHFNSYREMLMVSGWSVIGSLTLSNLLAAASVWLRQKIAWSMAHSVSMKLVKAYTELPYQFFLSHDSSELIKKVIADVNNLVTGVLVAGSQFLCQLIISVAILSLLLVVQPIVALGSFVLFVGVYCLIYLNKRKYLTQLGREKLDANYCRFKTFVELITGIKAIKSDGAKKFFVDRHEEASLRYSAVHPKVTFVSAVPRYLVESVAFGGLVGVTLYLVATNVKFIDALPVLTLFALAGYRLIPALNTAYVSMALVLNNYPAIEDIYDDIHTVSDRESAVPAELEFNQSIELRDVTFRYDSSTEPVLKQISMTIPKGYRVGFVGPSGSGKTTLFDVMMGLLSQEDGQILVDGVEVDETTMQDWQQMIGYVPQDVFLYDDTLANNVAFGAKEIDHEKVREVCKVAQLEEFIEEQLSNGYETLVGERGMRLSGGQRQRLGLARALYRQPRILMLDEATSALDSVTEQQVVQAIYGSLPEVTIIVIAHRVSTVQQCDLLYVMDRGKLVEQGSYDELIASSGLFRDLARFT